MITPVFKSIEKEEVASLKFPNKEVLADNTLIKQRDNDLKRALSLGNLEHSKIKIYFEDDISRKYVETTVWGVTDKRVILKQNMVIPINRIYKITN
jgi:hypothetical protein